ncbi:MAG: hypothetical protein OEY33_00790 [Bdellovibrionales bacterium]|nr:hypothetical protein [Bdellovibrionales bacterium]
MLKFPNVNRLSYTDTSNGQSGQIIRELKQARVDIKNSAVDIINELRDLNVEDSPYVTDRKHLDINRILGHPHEPSWKEVDSYDQSRSINLNLKKLNII